MLSQDMYTNECRNTSLFMFKWCHCKTFHTGFNIHTCVQLIQTATLIIFCHAPSQGYSFRQAGPFPFPTLEIKPSLHNSLKFNTHKFYQTSMELDFTIMETAHFLVRNFQSNNVFKRKQEFIMFKLLMNNFMSEVKTLLKIWCCWFSVLGTS